MVVDMSFSQVGVTVTSKRKKKELLAGATGEFRSGRVFTLFLFVFILFLFHFNLNSLLLLMWY